MEFKPKNIVPEMTYYVSSGMLNPTHSLIHNQLRNKLAQSSATKCTSTTSDERKLTNLRQLATRHRPGLGRWSADCTDETPRDSIAHCR